VSIVAIIASMAFVHDEATRSYLVPSLISLALVVAAAFIRGRRGRGRPLRGDPRGLPGPARHRDPRDRDGGRDLG
jgi:hypothetical protein